jgi:hypothetical protein
MTIRHPIYLLYGLSLIGGSAYLESRGFTFRSMFEDKNAPKSIRNNPGGGRALYHSSPRYSGGK